MTKDNTNRPILVVDDDLSIWTSYEAILQPSQQDKHSPLEQLKGALSHHSTEKEEKVYSFQLSFAAQGKEGLDLIKEVKNRGNPFHLAFIDIRMPPGWDGMETARRIREIDQEVEIVIVSAYSDRTILEITNAVGLPHKLLFLRKPFDPDELKQLAISLTDKFLISRKEERQREKLEVLLDTSSAGVFTVDSDNTLLTWNRAAEEITGYTQDEVLHKPLILDEISTEIVHISSDNTPENTISSQQRTFIDKGKNTKIISLTLASITTRKKSETIGSFWDITSQKEAENALRDANVELQKQMKERARLQENELKLERKLNQAQKMEAIGLMAGGVAHDLNNILSSIVGYPDLILMDLPQDSKHREALEVIEDSGKRAAAVVADLLTIAQGVAVGKEVADLNNLVIRYLESAEGKLMKESHPHIIIQTFLTSDDTSILCSPVHIGKCLMNLLNNAAEALIQSSYVTITTTRKTISANDRSRYDVVPGEYVTLTVKDQGPGISSEDLRHIFEPFFTTKKIGRSGTGLGLTVVYNTVIDHNGTINVKSDENGTTFTLLIPLSSEKSETTTRSFKIEDIQNTGTILVVDDEKQQGDVAKTMLEALGYTVWAVTSGEDAVTYLTENTVDLVLLDMIMHPGMNGLRSYEEIKKIQPDQKAIITSGYSESNEVLLAKQLGVKAFIGKPYTLEEIGHVVKKILALP